MIVGPYEAKGPEANDLRNVVSEALADFLAPEVTIVNLEMEEVEKEWSRIGEEFQLQTEPVIGFNPEDELFFAQGIQIEHLLRRQGLDSSTGEEISPADLDALLASERSRDGHR